MIMLVFFSLKGGEVSGSFGGVGIGNLSWDFWWHALSESTCDLSWTSFS